MLSTKLKEAAGNSADATLYVDDVFSTWLYTGNGSTQTITNGIDLAGKGGMVWTKPRDLASSHRLFDTARGVNKELYTDSSTSESSVTNSITAFNSNGFTMGSSWPNISPYTYASWTFRKAAKFFDVVTYTGTGSARTIAHSLGVAPGMVIVKRIDTTGNWRVYHRSLTSAAYSIQLNLTDAQASAPTVWNSTAPTSSVFSVGTDATVNASGGTYVAYLYAHDTSSTGIIQCGSFTTDGSGNATVNLGWEPQYLLMKRTDALGNWSIQDVMRGVGGNNPLTADTSDAEGSGPTYGLGVSPLKATGFNVGSTANMTVIYMAIRMPNKPPTTGTQVYLPSIAASGYVTTGFTVDALLQGIRAGAGGFPAMMDRLRGVSTTPTAASTLTVTTSSSAAETNTNASSQGWDNTGFTALQAGAVNWTFKRAPGFFDEVCYTGTGSATTQAHNLTVVPELIIVKERSAINNWWVYVSSVGNTKYSVLNSTAIPTTSSTAWNNTTPTASVFSIGTATNVNASAQTFVAYLFATLAGISKVGSYTGNGTGQAIACGFSGGARFVLIKRTDSTGSWYTFDSARGLTSGSSPYLLLNSTAAEVTGNNGVYASTGGFTLGSTASTTTNINGASYIYLSVA